MTPDQITVIGLIVVMFAWNRWRYDVVAVFGVDKFAESAMVIKGRIKTKPIKQWDVGREFLRRIKLAFNREGIEIPFPHRTLHFPRNEDADSASAWEKLARPAVGS